MSARTVTTREFVCDHCDEMQVFEHDAAAGRAGWAILAVNNKVFALCPEHYQELKTFLAVDSFGPPLGSVQLKPAGLQQPAGIPAPHYPPTITPGIGGVHYPTQENR